MSREFPVMHYVPTILGANDTSEPRDVIVQKIEGDHAQVRDHPGSKLYVVPVERLFLKFR